MLRMGLRRRLSLLFVAIFAATAMLLHITQEALLEADADAATLTRAHEIRESLERIRSGLRGAVAAQRGFLLTGERSFLSIYRDLLPALDEARRHLGERLQDDAEQAARLQEFDALVAERVAQLEEALVVRARSGPSAARALVQRDDRLRLEGALTSLADRIRSQSTRRLEAHHARSLASRRSARWTAALAVALSGALLLLAFVLVFRAQRQRWRAEQELRRGSAQLAESLQEMDLLARDLRALTEFGGELQASATLAEAMVAIAEASEALLPDSGGQVLLRTPADPARLQEAGRWGEHALASAGECSADDCWALRRGKAHLVDHPEARNICAHVRASDLQAATYLCLPLEAQGERLGVLHFNRWRPLDERERQLAANLAEQISLAVANLRLRDALRIEAIQDPLTGLYNRRYLDASLAREVSRAARADTALAVMMIDLDHFKAYNDAHGHDGGDALLAAFGGVLRQQARAEDIACRYGGEEFTLILTGAGASQALARAAAIATALSALAPTLGGRTLPSTTASIGISVFPAHGQQAAELLSQADAALYAAKHAGRDRAIVAST